MDFLISGLNVRKLIVGSNIKSLINYGIMELLEGLFSRRSIRRYTGEKLTEKQIQLLLKAAMQAPSAVNCQPWHFLVITSREKMIEVTEVHPYAQMLKEAACAILVLGDTKLEHAPGYWAVDCAAATENILLAAHGMGFGAVWIGIHPRVERRSIFKKLFHLPDHIQPFALISIGYPAEEKPVEERYKKERVHINKW